ncbi:cation diffusion facilitator family transporter [uncultured Acetobacteroides sp.]|uniref:cation diffusion facilitator family transporter n=1 Tax=uncultured Acetobacteroides sp. TaxID=1760811 RepID=UPI0029F527C3|nr:cation diffusion facilitator family transporter [uncultured Acetobacteroides sp.]
MSTEKEKVAGFSVLAAVFLTGFKLLVGIVTGSLGILSEALHSTLDLVAAIITYFSVRISDKPADYDHNFGHGKVENLSALIETLLLLLTCVWIIYEAASRLISGNTHIEVTVWSYVVVVLSIVIDYTRSRALYKVAKKHNSQALEADALHFATDIWSSAVVLLGLVCSSFGFYFADSFSALAVALIVLGVSYKLGRRAIDVLLDRAPKELFDEVSALLEQQQEVECYHDLKVRVAGADTFINVTIHLHPELSLTQAHAISHKVEEYLSSSISRCEVQIHYEPHETEVSTKKNEIHELSNM